ncbi:hypothetical protein [Paraburkholderia sp. UYCP14C]|uniref:hypothetical protein n=1 Tax=Paraburkholderia sp. UYCP14C TaxID=2511130 RepID=UPI0035A0C182
MLAQTRLDTDQDGKPRPDRLRAAQPAEVAEGLKTPAIVQPSVYYANPTVPPPIVKAPVQIGSVVEIIFIDLDTLSIEQDGVPNRGRGGIAEPERAEVELRLANAMHQLDAGNRDRGTSEPFESKHHVRS